MILINSQQLLVDMAMANETHPLHNHAKEYTKGLRELREKYGKTIKFIRPGFPKTNPGMDSEGHDATLVEPTPPANFPMRTYHSHPIRGKELWECCLSIPKLLPNMLWDMGDKRSITVTDAITVSLENDADLAYYLYYISRAVQVGRLKVDDPKADMQIRADRVKEDLNRKTAVWHMLDESSLRRMASAYGVSDVDEKEDVAIRFELEDMLIKNDDKKKRDVSVKGTAEFLDEMKVTDNIRLRAFMKGLLDKKVLVYKPDGRLWVGEKNLLQVPANAIHDVFNYICNFYGAVNNADKLKELMHDVMTSELLGKFDDDKDFTWLSKVLGIQTAFKKKEETRRLVYEAFSFAL